MVWHDGRGWSWDPWAEFERWQRAFEHPAQVRANVLPTRVHANEERVELHVAVPGRVADDIDLAVEGDVLTVKVAALREEGAGTPGPRVAREIPRQAVERRFQVPWSIARDQVRATLRDGLLKIELARAPEDRPRRIPVQAQ